MSGTNKKSDHRLALAEVLVEKLRVGDEKAVLAALDRLNAEYKLGVFKELGLLAQRINERLAAIRLDDQLIRLAQTELPLAIETLAQVLRMTDDAATKTLDALEEVRPMCQGLRERSQSLSTKWERFLEGDMTVEEFRGLSTEVRAALLLSSNEASLMGAHLNDILLAQEFQDLTGQMIKRVRQTTEGLCAGLMSVIQAHHSSVGESDQPPGAEEVRGKLGGTHVAGQEEVDGLLSELGL